MGTSKPIEASAASPFEVPERNFRLVVQELQMGGTIPACGLNSARIAELTKVWRQD
jgi:hypothetical protein